MRFKAGRAALSSLARVSGLTDKESKSWQAEF